MVVSGSILAFLEGFSSFRSASMVTLSAPDDGIDVTTIVQSTRFLFGSELQLRVGASSFFPAALLLGFQALHKIHGCFVTDESTGPVLL